MLKMYTYAADALFFTLISAAPGLLFLLLESPTKWKYEIHAFVRFKAQLFRFGK